MLFFCFALNKIETYNMPVAINLSQLAVLAENVTTFINNSDANHDLNIYKGVFSDPGKEHSP